MEPDLTEEQRLLAESAARFVEKEYSFERRNRLLATEERLSRDHWATFAELGWLGIALPEAAGGLGAGAVETSVLCEAFGRAMVLEPYLSTAVLCGRALALADDSGPGRELLPRIASGDLMMALAYAEPGSRYDLHHVAARAEPAGNAFTVSGEKRVVLDAPAADRLVVSARLAGETRDAGGIGLFVVDPRGPGVALASYPTMDGRRAADVRLAGAPVALLAGEERGLEVLEQAVEWGTAALCAQAVGAMDAACRQTLDYARTREQFGASIGSFQVIQHRLVDLFMAVRESRSLMRMAAADVMDDDPGVRRRSVSTAKCLIGERARGLAQDVVQIHGGVGFSEELAIGHYFRYLTLFCTTFGSTDHHLERYAELLGD